MHINVPPITLLQLFAVVAVIGLFHALITKRVAVRIAWFALLVVMLIACIFVVLGG